MLEGLASYILFVVSGEKVVRSTSLILLASIVVVNFCLENMIGHRILLVSILVTKGVAVITFLPQIRIFILLLLKFLLASSGIRNSKIFIESFTFYIR